MKSSISNKKPDLPHGVTDIIGMLERFLEYNKGGLMPFFDENTAVPTGDLMYFIAIGHSNNEEENIRVQGGGMIQAIDSRIDAIMEIEKIIRRYGGVNAIRQKCKIYEVISPKDANILKDVSKIGEFGLPNMTAVASLYRMNTHTLRRRIKRSVCELACLIYAKNKDSGYN